jgi:murein DD-endopeptidase MepM/ murein hydrolase activator NlpD
MVGFLGKKVKVFIGLIVLLTAAGLVALLVMSGGTSLSANPAPTVIGVSTPVTVRIANPHGVRRVAAYIEQNGARYPLFDRQAPATRLFWHRHEAPFSISFDAGKSKAPNLKDGTARVVVEAVSNDLRAGSDSAAYNVKVSLEAPRVAADGFQHYVNQAGMELVTFTPSGSWTEAGVKVGAYTFRSFPLPGHPDQRFSMFAYPWDLPPDVTPVVYARNAAGTEAKASFWFKLFPKKFRTRDLAIDGGLIEKLVNSVDPTGQVLPGKSVLDRFLYINSEMRRKNNQQLADLRFKTEEKILWRGPFLHWGKEEANFADARDYVYQGRKVDHQVHLGFDLSDVVGGGVQAANDGRVVWAGDLGIFGNCIVLDHGYGLQSIYGHLQRIDVKVGDMVQKGGKMAIAGSTGLAEGVHVHFGMQIDGVQINPREWWDEHWIKDRILSKLAPEKISELSAEAAPPPAHAKARRRRR